MKINAEGNYFFSWEAISATGIIEGQYEQTIYGVNLADAVTQFENFHGTLTPDENGVCLVITAISWSPLAPELGGTH
jgi:hypothetical protein